MTDVCCLAVWQLKYDNLWLRLKSHWWRCSGVFVGYVSTTVTVSKGLKRMSSGIKTHIFVAGRPVTTTGNQHTKYATSCKSLLQMVNMRWRWWPQPLFHHLQQLVLSVIMCQRQARDKTVVIVVVFSVLRIELTKKHFVDSTWRMSFYTCNLCIKGVAANVSSVVVVPLSWELTFEIEKSIYLYVCVHSYISGVVRCFQCAWLIIEVFQIRGCCRQKVYWIYLRFY